MKKNNETPFERKSRSNVDRMSFLDKDFNYVYVYEELSPTGKYVTKKCIIPYSEENRNILILLDDEDHSSDLADRYEDENKDTDFVYDQIRRLTPGSKYSAMDDPLECIPDPTVNFYKDDEVTIDANSLEFLHDWIFSLPQAQLDLFIKHFVERKSYQEIRDEEEKLTGNSVSRQAIANRCNKILAKAQKYLSSIGYTPDKK